MWRLIPIAFAVALALTAGQAAPQISQRPSSQPQPSAATEVSGVDVVAPAPLRSPPTRAAVEAYVGAIGVMSTAGQLAIWSRTALPSGTSAALATPADSVAGQTICPQILGLPDAYADFIAARIRQAGRALGAPVSDKACAPLANNIAIVFPADAAAFIKKLAEDKPEAFGFPSHGALTADLARPPAPIRAWYGVQVVVSERRASRLSTAHQSVIFQVLIVVDRDKTEALDMGQLADYLTMISLAQINPDKVPPTAPSILNVFADIAAGRPPAPGMTRIDAAYLQALYAIGPRQPGEQQNKAIASLVRTHLARR